MSTAKHKGKGPQVMTANALVGGGVVWMTDQFEWTPDFGLALKTEDVDVIETMRETALRSEEANDVVGAYFIDIDPDTGLPVRYREKFRVSGPSNDLSYAKSED